MIQYYCKQIFYWLVPVLMVTGCGINETHYFADAENDGIAIFSNTGNNLLTCYIDAKPWRTIARQQGILGPPRPTYEVYIQKRLSGTGKDTLSISWEGYFGTRDTLRRFITARLAVDSGFSATDLNALQGRRISLEGSNGYFLDSARNVYSVLMGTGHLYFHTLQLESTGPGAFSGSMSGLMDADFGTEKITNGRFDHSISPEQVQFQ